MDNVEVVTLVCGLMLTQKRRKSFGLRTGDIVSEDYIYCIAAWRSRLGCQICLTKSLEGLVARVPESVADIRQSKDGSA